MTEKLPLTDASQKAAMTSSAATPFARKNSAHPSDARCSPATPGVSVGFNKARNFNRARRPAPPHSVGRRVLPTASD